MEQESDHKFDEFIHSEMNDFRIEPTSEDQWERLHADLDKAAVKLSYWKKFNIVYVIAILVITAVAVLLYSNRKILFNTTNSKYNFHEPTSVKYTTDSSTNKNPVLNDPSLMSKGDVNIKTDRSSNIISSPTNSYRNIDLKSDMMDNDIKKQKSRFPEQAEEPEQALPEKDSAIAILAPETKVEQKQATLPKPKKIRYVTKRDTLLVIDTTITKKKR